MKKLIYELLVFICGTLVWAGCECNSRLGPDFETDKNVLLYNELSLSDSLIQKYKNEGMLWFYPCYVSKTRDSNNVPYVEYPFGTYYNPVTVSETAFAYHSEYLRTGKEEYKQSFINNADWIVNNHNGQYYYIYDFPFTHGNGPELPAGWVSGMAQGMVLGVLSVAYNLTGDSTYNEVANGIFQTFVINSDSLWCFYVDQDGYYWIEEYPNPDYCHVLNGKFFALWGIWNYYVISGSQTALNVLKAGIRSIADNYLIWKVPGQQTSYYCMHKCIFNLYHQIHILQFQHFGDFFKIPEFVNAVDCYTGQCNHNH